GLSRCVDEGEVARIAQLHVIEDVESLHAKLHLDPLGQLRLLAERHIELPVIQSPNQPVSGISIASKISVRIQRRSLESSGVDQRSAWRKGSGRPRTGQGQRHSRNDIGSLVRLIVAIGKEITVRKSVKGPSAYVAAEVHLHG